MKKSQQAYLVGFVEQAQPLSDLEFIHVVVLGALGELVGLHVLQPHDGLRHDAAVPVTAKAVLTPIIVPHTWTRQIMKQILEFLSSLLMP